MPAHTTAARTLLHTTPARLTRSVDTPWVPLGPGRAFKPIRFLSNDRGYVALMRVDPGTVIPPHRHTGEVHALNLEGDRELCSGERIGPGDYVFEPAGNIDTWQAVGDQPAIVLISVFGAVEYLDDDGNVATRFSSRSMEAVYRTYCAANGINIHDLLD